MQAVETAVAEAGFVDVHSSVVRTAAHLQSRTVLVQVLWREGKAAVVPDGRKLVGSGNWLEALMYASVSSLVHLGWLRLEGRSVDRSRCYLSRSWISSVIQVRRSYLLLMYTEISVGGWLGSVLWNGVIDLLWWLVRDLTRVLIARHSAVRHSGDLDRGRLFVKPGLNYTES